MNPSAKPVKPRTSKGCERDLARFLMIYQSAVEDDPEDNRFATRDRSIQPLGTGHAADICGRTRSYMQNTLNPFNETNPPGLKEFYRLWYNGLDDSVIAELLRPRGKVAYDLPDHDEAGDPRQMAQHAVHLGKEIGDVFAMMESVFKAESDGGRKVTPRELAEFERECHEVIPKVLQLIADMKGIASCR